jgi:hypothetical protein
MQVFVGLEIKETGFGLYSSSYGIYNHLDCNRSDYLKD